MSGFGSGVGAAFQGIGTGIGAAFSGLLSPVANIVNSTFQGATGLLNTPGGQGALGAVGTLFGGGVGSALTALSSGAAAGKGSTDWLRVVLILLAVATGIGLLWFVIKKLR